MTASSTPEYICRFREMMRSLDVDLLEFRYDAFGATIEAARRTCERCDSVETCADWLSFCQEQGAPPDFCPNQDVFERFRQG